MQYRRLGRTGLKVSEISLGSWVTFGTQLDLDNAVNCLKEAYDAGINFFDNAEAYAMGDSERLMGESLRKLGLRRASYVISTKFYWGLHDGPNEKNTLNRKRLMDAIDGSLLRFGMDCIDLVYCHRDDLETPVEEVVRAMSDMIVAGKAHYWGTSEWSAARIQQAIEVADRYGWHKPQMEQPHYNLLGRARFEQEYRPLFEQHGYGSTTFSPLASGLLSGKYLDGIPEGSRMSMKNMEWLKASLTDENLGRVRALAALAEELGSTVSQLAIAWVLMNPNVSSVITGASRIEQLRENLGAAAVAEQLDDDTMARIDAIFPVIAS